MQQKPKLSFWQIWTMSFGYFGIQFGFALQNANVSRIFESLWASIENIPILWIAAPVKGLIIQPIIGRMSDNTWNRLGRRRPYFLVGAILASFALLIIPMLWIGLAWVSILAMPYALLTGSLPAKKMGTYMGIFNFFIVIPQILAALFGLLVRDVDG